MFDTPVGKLLEMSKSSKAWRTDHGQKNEDQTQHAKGPIEWTSSPAFLPGFAMHRVGATEPAELLEFQSILRVRLVLGCDVVAPFALGAGERQRRSLV
jgi:hypothetical protein